MNEVLYFARMAPHYRHAALSRLNARLGGRLVVCSGTPPRASAFASMVGDRVAECETVPMRNLWMQGERLHIQPFGHVFRRYPRPSVVIAEESVRSVTLPLLLRRARRAGAARLLWGHFSSNHRPFSLRSPFTRYRLALAKRVEGCICYTDSVADLLRPYVSSERLFVARNTLDTGELLRLHERLSQTGRSEIRARLGATAPVMAYIGRLTADKKIAFLLEVFAILRKRHPQASLCVVGDGPERKTLEAAQRRLGGIHCTGALTDWADSAPYLYSADVLLNPGYLGLSVNHAFALGLPVVSQRSPDPLIRYHSPEVDYLKVGGNGLLSPYGDAAAMADAVDEIIDDHDRYSRNALDYARTHLGLGHLVDGVVQAVKHAEKFRKSA